MDTLVTVPESFDLRIDLHPDGGIYRRYAAGIASLLDRADLAVRWDVCRVQARHYQDEDLEVRFEAGDLGIEPCSAIDRRRATIRGVVAWHRTGGNNLTDHPLYVKEYATILVLSRSGRGETAFLVRSTELARIKERIRDVIFRDHIMQLSLDANSWRMESDSR